MAPLPSDSDLLVDEHGNKIQGALFAYLTKTEAKVRELVNNKPMEFWEKCWEENVTPWDVGGVTPIIAHLAKQGSLPQGRALVPGCGSGYDVLALATPTRHVVGLDISEKALARAKELAAASSKGEWVEYLNADFYTWDPIEPFDLIFDYTFFCAMEPPMRAAWGKRMAELLAPDGELLTLMFPMDDHEGGPPYAVSKEAYEEVLHPLGFKAFYCDNNVLAVESRKGREMVARWSRVH